MPVRIGVVLPDSVSPGEALPDVAGLARVAEAAGLDGVWAEDTFPAGDRPVLDATLTLAVAAAVTSRISVGFAIFVPSLRPLGWAARQVASLQHHASGRLQLGVGIGGGRSASEYLAVGMRLQDRAARTDDFLRLLPDLLGGRPVVIPDCSSAGPVQAFACCGDAARVDRGDLAAGTAASRAVRRRVAVQAPDTSRVRGERTAARRAGGGGRAGATPAGSLPVGVHRDGWPGGLAGRRFGRDHAVRVWRAGRACPGTGDRRDAGAGGPTSSRRLPRPGRSCCSCSAPPRCRRSPGSSSMRYGSCLPDSDGRPR
jgi:Luciferase-like monooxygenase